MNHLNERLPRPRGARVLRAAQVGVAAVLAGLAMLMAAPARAADEPAEQVQVADPFLELHTGPGRGYPVFHVSGRGDSVEILSRHTDWFKVRLSNGKLGWVERAQLETTLTQLGSRKTFRDVLLDDYLRRRVEMGMAWGRFKSEPVLKVWAGYRLSDTLSTEVTVGQVQGVFSGTDFWHIGVNAEPWSDRRLSPFVGIGLGKFKNIPNTSLVSAITTNAQLAHATAGLRWHLSERFVARADYSIYTAYVADSRSSEYRAFTAGISFFF
jgi:hypothetical protein